MPVRTSTSVAEDERSTTNVHLPLWMFLHNWENSVKQHTNVYVGQRIQHLKWWMQYCWHARVWSKVVGK